MLGQLSPHAQALQHHHRLGDPILPGLKHLELALGGATLAIALGRMAQKRNTL